MVLAEQVAFLTAHQVQAAPVEQAAQMVLVELMEPLMVQAVQVVQVVQVVQMDLVVQAAHLAVQLVRAAQVA